MPDVVLTPVAGDPWSGGARELDPRAAPPLVVTLPEPEPQGWPWAAVSDPARHPTPSTP